MPGATGEFLSLTVLGPLAWIHMEPNGYVGVDTAIAAALVDLTCIQTGICLTTSNRCRDSEFSISSLMLQAKAQVSRPALQRPPSSSTFRKFANLEASCGCEPKSQRQLLKESRPLPLAFSGFSVPTRALTNGPASSLISWLWGSVKVASHSRGDNCKRCTCTCQYGVVDSGVRAYVVARSSGESSQFITCKLVRRHAPRVKTLPVSRARERHRGTAC